MVLPDTEIESSKLEAFREIMQELKENRHRVLVFSQFVKHLDILKVELDDLGISVSVHGVCVAKRVNWRW